MYTILTPPQIEMGSGSLKSLKEIIASHGTGRVLIVTDKGIRQAGILDRVIKATEKNTKDFDIFDRVLPNPDISAMEACGQVVESNDYALVIGLGGGSPMDVAKAASVLPANGGKLSPLLGRDMIKKPVASLSDSYHIGNGIRGNPGHCSRRPRERDKEGHLGPACDPPCCNSRPGPDRWDAGQPHC